MVFYEPELSESELASISKEFRRVKENIYLDHAGTTLYSEQQVANATKVLQETLFCNPHTCRITEDLIDQVRFRILQNFNTNANEYAVIFTSNATAALKLVAETFDFGEEGGSFYYCQENHTSVVGMRELVQTDEVYVLSKDELLKNLDFNPPGEPQTGQRDGNSLLVFSAQCNFSGYKLPLDLVEKVQRDGLTVKGKQLRGDASSSTKKDQNNFYVCVDTASYASTNFLDLKKHKIDFCCLSFYKMFGYPTGVGALLVSERGQEVLRKKKYFGGGTVKISMTREDFHVKRDDFKDRFQDGTLPFLSVISLLEGFRTIERLIPPTPTKTSMERVASHVFGLAKYAHDELAKLRHGNGAPVVKFYNHCGYEKVSQQGGIVAFNLLHDDGSFVGYAEVACIADIHKIQLRTGCFCNSGACQQHLQLTNTELRKQFAAGSICSDFTDLVDGQPTGAVRVSCGYMTHLHDINQLVDMIRECYCTKSIKPHNLIQEKQHTLPKALQHIPERMRPQLKKICIYPVKSCAAFEITDKWQLTSSGLKYDRHWMLVDGNGVTITQKHHVRLCLIRPTVDLSTGMLTLSFPEMKSIQVPLESTDDDLDSSLSATCPSKVCSDLVEGFDCGDKVAAWLSDCLETSGIRLLRQNTKRRKADGTIKEISLANQAQFLLINRNSVSWIANKIDTEKEPLDNTVDRFRGNLIIDTMFPFDENLFHELTIGDVKFKVDGFCTRCQMICIDQHSGQKTVEPLRTIAREFEGKIRFGIYLSLEDGTDINATISCTDRVTAKKI